MLVPAKQASVVELKLAETVRNDRAIADAAAKMNTDLSRSLLVSRMLTGFAITAWLLVLYVVQHQGSTIQAQQELIRQLHQDNQMLLQYRLQNPPAAAQQQQQQPAEQPSQDDGSVSPTANPATRIHMADGCRVGICA